MTDTLAGRINKHGEMEWYLPFDPPLNPHIWMPITDQHFLSTPGILYQCIKCMTIQGEPGDESCPL